MLLGHAIYLKGLGLLTDGGMSDLSLKKKKSKKERERKISECSERKAQVSALALIASHCSYTILLKLAWEFRIYEKKEIFTFPIFGFVTKVPLRGKLPDKQEDIFF